MHDSSAPGERGVMRSSWATSPVVEEDASRIDPRCDGPARRVRQSGRDIVLAGGRDA